MKFLELLKAANESRNKQRHRTTSNSKRGRQLIAASKNPQDNHLQIESESGNREPGNNQQPCSLLRSKGTDS